MVSRLFLFLLCTFYFYLPLQASDSTLEQVLEEVPVSHQGRFRPWIAEKKLDTLTQAWIGFLAEEKELNAPAHLLKPLRERLLMSGETLKALPGRYSPGEWYSLHALSLQISSPVPHTLEPIGNFTLYSDPQFKELQSLFLQLKRLPPSNPLFETLSLQFFSLLKSQYEMIALHPYIEGVSSSLVYPPFWKIRLEAFYLKHPWIEWIFALYLLSFFCWMVFYFISIPFWKYNGMLFLGLAFLFHTTLLAVRCLLLGRPPVSNMEETLLYVPWLSVLAGGACAFFYRTVIGFSLAAFASTLMLGICSFSFGAPLLENVQPVLNSSYWLVVHVLMIVGSYAFFLLASAFAHLYLLFPASLSSLSKFLLQLLYIGTALLICGTLLGGVWAAQSWGRFWDWDPKESWAFISICTYLLLIHAWRFGHIGAWGLAMGSLLGWHVIFFTWYGVNFVLRAGLHSYGFGAGGISYLYLLVLCAEFAFAFILTWFKMACDFKKIRKKIFSFLEKKSSIP